MTYTGPFPFDNTGTIDGILVTTSFTGRLTNQTGATITTSGIDVVGSTINGQIVSGGTLAGGINIDLNSQVNAPGDVGIFVDQGNFAGGIHNGGTISAAGDNGIIVGANSFSGVVTNTGTINAAIGIRVATSNVSVFDSGTITGTTDAIVFIAGHNTLTLAAGYGITGTVQGAGSDTLQLGGSGSASFDPSKIGSAQQYRGFTAFNVIGGTWTLTAAAAESWTIKAGTLELGTGASIIGQTITFAGSGATLQIDTAMSQIASTTIASAMIGDAIDLRFQSYSAGMHAVWTHTNDAIGTLALLAGNGNTLASFSLRGVYDAAQFQAMSDNNGGTLIQITAPLLPTLSVQNQQVVPGAVGGANIPITNVATVTDPFSVGYKQLQLWDAGSAIGQLFMAGQAQTPGHEIDVASSALGSVAFDPKGAVAGTDTLWARLLQNDGVVTQWQLFTVTTAEASLTTQNYTTGIAPSNSGPVIGLITINDPSGVGYQQLRLWDSAGGTDARFSVNGVPQNVGQEIDLTPAQANVTTFTAASAGFGGGTDKLWAQLLETDGTLTPWQPFTVTVDPPLTLNSIAAATPFWLYNVASTFFAGTNFGSATPQQLQLWDSVGGAGGRFEVNGATQNPGQEIDLNVNDPAFTSATFLSSQLPGTDRLWARLLMTNGTLTPYQPFTVTVAEPTLTTNTIAAAAKSSSINLLGASGLLTINDPSGVQYKTLELWDSVGGAGGRFMVGNTQQNVGQEIDLTPAQAATVTFTAASVAGTDKLWAQLVETDGTVIPWQPFTVTVPQPSLKLFTVIAGKNHNTGTSLVQINDPGNVGYQKLELWDSVRGEGFFTVAGNVMPQGQEIDVLPGTSWSFTTGSIGGTDRLWAQLMLNDGTVTGYQPMAAVVLQPTATPVQSTTTATEGQAINLSSLISISDPIGVGYQTLELWQSLGGAGGQFAVSGMAQTGGHEIDVSAADISDTVFNASTVAGGTDQLWVQLKQNDGTETGWTPFSVAVAPAPTLSVNNYSGADAGQFIPLSSMVTVLDPGHENYQTLELWDSAGTVGGGVFVVNGVGQTSGHEIDVSLTDAAITGFFAGSAGVTDRLWAQLKQNDGTTTGYQLFTVSTHT